MTRYSWDNSKCKGIFLHNYQIIHQYPNAVKEICNRCGKMTIFRIENGRIDNNHYIAHHIRQMLVPQHKLYGNEYRK